MRSAPCTAGPATTRTGVTLAPGIKRYPVIVFGCATRSIVSCLLSFLYRGKGVGCHPYLSAQPSVSKYIYSQPALCTCSLALFFLFCLFLFLSLSWSRYSTAALALFLSFDFFIFVLALSSYNLVYMNERLSGVICSQCFHVFTMLTQKCLSNANPEPTRKCEVHVF